MQQINTLISKVFTILILFLLITLTTGCATKIVYKDRLIPVITDENVFKSCPKPKKVSTMFSSLDIKKASEDEITTAFDTAYAGHLDCYKTLLNVKNTEIETKNKIEEANAK